ncbi:hypothetical protein JHK87_043176 [Glycine soja]|nr:hypothetical protein JHK87_043176 [Glycine soja]
MSTSWSNLKKVILLRRFIKSLEKVRKFNPRGPRYLPLEPNSEAEKVNLRHQDMEERKGTEEWMLDYALRQVVSKLTPARKRKVELLSQMQNICNVKIEEPEAEDRCSSNLTHSQAGKA